MRRRFSMMFAILKSRARKRVYSAAFALAIAAIAPAAMPQDVPMSVRLTSTLNVAGAPVGQSVMGEVLSPDAFKSDVVKGRIIASKVSKGKVTLEFQFEYLHHAGNDYKIMAKIVSVQNSKGQQSMDEAGHSVQATTIPGKGPKQRKFSGNLGGMIGMPSDSPGTASHDKDEYPPSIRVVGEGADSTLAIGSMLGISARSDGMGDLTGLKPNGQEVDPYALPSFSDAKPAASPTSAAGQPEMKSAAIDFIPGERTIFFDDFTDVGADEILPHWPVHDGKIEMRPKEDAPPEMYAPDSVALTSPPMIVPANFTFQSE